MCDTVFGLEWFLNYFQYFKQDVSHSVWLRMVFTLVPVLLAGAVTQSLV